MKLGRDSEKRSTLLTKETITAQFPDYDQNHGLERIFVDKYDGHPTNLKVTSVTDENGASLPYSLSGGVMRIGRADTYVHGTKTYVIAFTQRDVTRFYADTNRDEFYWDAIGLDWNVPIDSAHETLALNYQLQSARSNTAACYQGAYQSTTKCTITSAETGYIASADALQANEGMTIAVGFHKGTFANYQRSLSEKIALVWGAVQAAIMIGVFVSVPVIIWRQRSRMNRTKEVKPTPVEYLPPGDASVTTSSKIIQVPRAVTTAQIIDLAVRHYIKIYETSPKTLFKPAEYELEIARDISGLRWEEQELLADSFGGKPVAGDRLQLSSLRNNTSYYMRTLNNDSGLTKLIRGEYGLRELDTTEQSRLRRYALIVFIIGLVTFSPVFWIVAGVQLGLSFACWRLTVKGLALRRYLEGLKEYIGMAEVDRIKLLQSPEGAEKVSKVVNGTDTAQLITLYERVLPYAVLFGLEKQWNAELGRYYETTNTQPGWYAGQSGVFNAAVFTAAMSNFSAANNYASSSSASSGGSGGGGFSGGGGGGGGGGGW
jgi:uncharacterized membrane protein YgcG